MKFIVAMCLIGLAFMCTFKVLDLKIEAEKLKKEVLELKMELGLCSRVLDNCNTELSNYQNHVKRMQMIVGIKNPDSIFTWKEKVTHPIKIK